MRRSVARGRIVPQSLSTDPRMGRLSLKAALLFPLMWINSDDQGRLSGDPDEIKYAVCPNIDHISKADIPELLNELETQGFIKLYSTSRKEAIQMLDWWEEQKLQWAYPSQYIAPPSWTDHLRYHPTPKEIITENWPPSGQLDTELPNTLPSKLPKKLANTLGSELPAEVSQTLPNDNEKEDRKRKGRGRGRGILPSLLGSNSSPPLTNIKLFQILVDTFPKAWGRIPDSRETAQLRDLGNEISLAGGATSDQVYDAFRETSSQNKLSISYTRAILLDWIGVERGKSA